MLNCYVAGSMLLSLPTVALQCLLGQIGMAEWALLTCTSKQLQRLVHACIQNILHAVTLRIGSKTRQRAKQQLKFAGLRCPCLTSLILTFESVHTFDTLQLLQPCLTNHLRHLAIRGANLFAEGFSASQLVALLVQKCPQLHTLDLQDCMLPKLSVFHQLLSCGALPQQSPRLRALNLTGAHITELAVGQAQHDIKPCANSGQLQGAPRAGCAEAVQPCVLQEVQLGCGQGSQHSSSTPTDASVVELLTVAGCKALQVLDVARRSSITNVIMQHLKLHQGQQLRVLDISLTRVTPAGLLPLLHQCPQLAVLRYACREGTQSLELHSIQQLVTACHHLQELDVSLHSGLDDACMAALAECKLLRKVTMSRSHKVTPAGLEQLLQAGHVDQLALLRCKGVSQRKLRSLRLSFPGVVIRTER